MSIHYDAQDSANEAMASAQMEADQREFENAIALAEAEHKSCVCDLEDALYCAVMTCCDAGDNRLGDWMPVICRVMNLPYPPRQLSH